MAKYRKKPVVVEAVQLVDENVEEFDRMEGVVILTTTAINQPEDIESGQVVIWTDSFFSIGYAEVGAMEGVLMASVGDWIITGIKGERYPCDPDIFEAIYERVEAGDDG